MRQTWSHPESSTMGVKGFTGFAGVAAHLSGIAGYEISRQGVYAWWRRRMATGFPDKHEITWESTTRTLALFDVAEVTAWFQDRQTSSDHSCTA